VKLNSLRLIKLPVFTVVLGATRVETLAPPPASVLFAASNETTSPVRRVGAVNLRYAPGRPADALCPVVEEHRQAARDVPGEGRGVGARRATVAQTVAAVDEGRGRINAVSALPRKPVRILRSAMNTTPEAWQGC
jgi:hypothetical protein